MRLLHPETIRIIALICKDEDFDKSTLTRRTIISHAWSEVLKYLATRQSHPKMWLNDVQLGAYMRVVKTYGDIVGCNLDEELIRKHDDVAYGYFVCAHNMKQASDTIRANENSFKFDDNYLFSDCMSLYFKGLNIFKYVYGDDWRRLVPVESLGEISRQVNRTLNI